MIQSMTGYAAASAETARGALSIELRSVNARFLDMQFRVSDELRSLERSVHRLEGLLIALDNLDAVIELIRGSRDRDAARSGLVAQFGLTELQAQAILELRL